jgi:membrane protein implicated in regulation of membrane protease activity
MEFFDILGGISPWYWIAFALALGALEMATFSFFLIWPALAAVVVAGLLFASPDMTGSGQITVFAIGTIAATALGRFLITRYGDGSGTEDMMLNKRGQRFVGRTAIVLEFANGHGHIEVEGMRWRATWPTNQTSKSGDQVRVVRADGLVLDVEPIVA